MTQVTDKAATAVSVTRLTAGVGELCSRLADPAAVVNTDHLILATNVAFENELSDGEQSVGRYCFEVLHNHTKPCPDACVSCPLRECRSTGRSTRVAHPHHAGGGMKLDEILCLPVTNHRDAIDTYLLLFRRKGLAKHSDDDSTELVGRSAQFNAMMELVNRVAKRDVPVLLVGESGTGKELVARAIHQFSSRAEHTMVTVECTGLTESLFESELFGHEKGAFTGATEARIGLVEACDGGTLFLDEIGDIPLAQQAKLLRVLETRTFRRVGASEQRTCDFRLLCATHRDLPEFVKNGAFRHDLYYRISAFPIHLPPLRARVEDLPVLIDALTTRLHCPFGCRIDPETLAALSHYPFPGNVRELLNVLSRACVLSTDGVIRPNDLPAEVCVCSAPQADSNPYAILPLLEHEHRYLRWAATVYRGPMSELAILLGVTDRTLYRKLRRAGATPRAASVRYARP